MMSAKKQTEVRVRYAPSPTGYFHIGGARTALFNYLFARQHNGKFLLRIEDTDRSRSKKEFEEEIISTMRWLGLDYDEGPLTLEADAASKLLAKPFKGEYGPYRQSERLDTYEKYVTRLLTEKKAYYCFCSQADLDAQRASLMSQGQVAVYSGTCRSLSEKEADAQRTNGLPSVIRIKVPREKLSVKDLVRGTVTFDTALIGDIVIAKNLREPLYNFVVVVDDYEMNISHVIRGDDHLANTPKQMAIAQALNLAVPQYAHLPVILSATGKGKMSKREGGTAVIEYRRDGYLPEALLNFLALIGWHPSDDNTELLSLQDAIRQFSLGRVQKAGAAFNRAKLDWFNAQYIKSKTDSELLDLLVPDYLDPSWTRDSGKLIKVIALTKERLKKLSEFKDLAGFFYTLPLYEAPLLTWKKSNATSASQHLSEIKKILQALPEIDFIKSRIETSIMPYADAAGRGDVLWPLRVAVSGLAASPGPFEIIEVLGKAETFLRLEVALAKFSK